MRSEREIRDFLWICEEEKRIHSDNLKFTKNIDIEINILKWVLKEDPRTEYIKKYLKEVQQ